MAVGSKDTKGAKVAMQLSESLLTAQRLNRICSTHKPPPHVGRKETTMKLKRKGIDFCAYPGCLSQEYAGEVDNLVYCSEHINEADERDRMYCEAIAKQQGVPFGKYAEG